MKFMIYHFKPIECLVRCLASDDINTVPYGVLCSLEFYKMVNFTSEPDLTLKVLYLKVTCWNGPEFLVPKFGFVSQ